MLKMLIVEKLIYGVIVVLSLAALGLIVSLPARSLEVQLVYQGF